MAGPVAGADGAAGDGVAVTMPAQLRFLAVARTVVSVATDQAGCDIECDDDLQLATDELAAVVIASSRENSNLRMHVAHDDHDIYVRMTAPVPEEAKQAEVPELSLILLTATVESFDMTIHDGEVLAVLQRRIRADRA